MDGSIEERLNDFIRRKGLRRTGQRDTIVKAAFSKDEHFTADELFDRARKKPLPPRALCYLGLAQLQNRQKLQGRDSLQRALAAGLPPPLAAQAKLALAEK